jgi:Epoxide hydrolase N terminus
MADNTAIRRFHFGASNSDLADLRQRIKATRWPDREQVSDPSQGVQLETMQKLADYWLHHHDWRRCEAKINAVPNFITAIDGLDFQGSCMAMVTRQSRRRRMRSWPSALMRVPPRWSRAPRMSS